MIGSQNNHEMLMFQSVALRPRSPPEMLFRRHSRSRTPRGREPRRRTPSHRKSDNFRSAERPQFLLFKIKYFRCYSYWATNSPRIFTYALSRTVDIHHSRHQYILTYIGIHDRLYTIAHTYNMKWFLKNSCKSYLFFCLLTFESLLHIF